MFPKLLSKYYLSSLRLSVSVPSVVCVGRAKGYVNGSLKKCLFNEGRHLDFVHDWMFRDSVNSFLYQIALSIRHHKLLLK